MWCRWIREVPKCTLDDQTVRIFLNTKGTNDDEVLEELREFLHYVENTTDEAAENVKSEWIRRVHERVCKVKASEKVGVKLARQVYSLLGKGISVEEIVR